MIYDDCAECYGTGVRRFDYDRDCISCELRTKRERAASNHPPTLARVIYLKDYRRVDHE